MTHQLAQVADRGRRHEAAGDQAVADQLGDPLGVLHVGLAAGHVLDVVGVADDQADVAFQHGIHRLPADAGAFHADVGGAVLGQPRPQGLQLARGRAEAAQQLLRLAPWHADQDAADNAGLVHIQAGATFKENLHGQHLSAVDGVAAAALQAKSDTADRARQGWRRQRMVPGESADRSVGRS